MFIPVPSKFSTIISPIFTGALTQQRLISFIQSKIIRLGIGFSVLTGTTGRQPFLTLTVLVTILTGFVHSARAYSSPRLHLYPLTLFIVSPSSVTSIRQPMGQFIQTSSLFSG